MKSAVILGLMSGTSLDGLDLCLVKFSVVGDNHQFEILKSHSVEYSADWQRKLSNAIHLSALDLERLDVELATYFGRQVNYFLENSNAKPDYIASHGHTIFHQPENGLTTQIGNGNTLFAETKIPVIYDFRSLDVARGGQGAPLVPFGDLHLFSKYVACINFGGIANWSYQKNGHRLANDICPVNMALSDLTAEINLPFDDGGNLARGGTVNEELLQKLNALAFYSSAGPKSLGIEWYQMHFQPLIKNKDILVKDRLRTVVEHIGIQIAEALNGVGDGGVLVTGGGVFNTFLMEVLQSKVSQKIIIPEKELVEFKEALIFAFLAWFKVNGKINILKSVTGANADSSGGIFIS